MCRDHHGDGKVEEVKELAVDDSRDEDEDEDEDEATVDMPDELLSLISDAHCHATDSMSTIPLIPSLTLNRICAMATRLSDQILVAQIAMEYPNKVIPAFGYHPYFTHLLYLDEPPSSPHEHYSTILHPPPDASFTALLPSPQPLFDFLTSLRENLEAHPNALVGEIGIDRAFLLPHPLENPINGRWGKLTKHKVRIEHQLAILRAQLDIAAEMGRAVSVHSVQSHGVLFEFFRKMFEGHKPPSNRQKKKLRDAPSSNLDPGPESPYKPPFPTRICLHSFSGSAEQVQQWTKPSIPALVYFSFSTLINARYERFAEVVRAVPGDRVLVESDVHGVREVEEGVRRAVEFVCRVKEWTLAEGVERLQRNFEAWSGTAKNSA
ncbi:Cut9-interacting protein scn1 [Saitoella coloradoensis]